MVKYSHTYIYRPILKRGTPGPSDEPQIRRDRQSDAGLGHSQERQPGLSRLYKYKCNKAQTQLMQIPIQICKHVW